MGRQQLKTFVPSTVLELLTSTMTSRPCWRCIAAGSFSNQTILCKRCVTKKIKLNEKPKAKQSGVQFIQTDIIQNNQTDNKTVLKQLYSDQKDIESLQGQRCGKENIVNSERTVGMLIMKLFIIIHNIKYFDNIWLH